MDRFTIAAVTVVTNNILYFIVRMAIGIWICSPRALGAKPRKAKVTFANQMMTFFVTFVLLGFFSADMLLF
jgi:hypothetical protein